MLLSTFNIFNIFTWSIDDNYDRLMPTKTSVVYWTPRKENESNRWIPFQPLPFFLGVIIWRDGHVGDTSYIWKEYSHNLEFVSIQNIHVADLSHLVFAPRSSCRHICGHMLRSSWSWSPLRSWQIPLGNCLCVWGSTHPNNSRGGSRVESRP